MSIFAVDGALSRRVLGAAEILGASAATLVMTAPTWLFAVTGGWQAAHTALWFGAATITLIGPAVVALLTVVRGVLMRRGASRHPLRHYMTALALGFSAWRIWLIGSGAALLIGYQVVTVGRGSTAMLLAAVLLALVCLTGGIGVACSTVLRGSAVPGNALDGVRAAVRRPAVLIVWAFVTAVAVLTPFVPVTGGILSFLAPAGWAVAVVVVNATFGFDDQVMAGVAAGRGARS